MNTMRNTHHTEGAGRFRGRPRRRWRVAALGCASAIAMALGGIPAAGTSAATSQTDRPYCGIYWGSLAKHSDPRHMTAARATWVKNVRSGRHGCFDRLVVDLRGPAPGYSVRYVTQVRTDGAGFLVPLRGGARLRVFVGAPAHTPSYRPTYTPLHPRNIVDVTGYRTFRQVAWAGSFEGRSTIGVGVRARLPFRVFTLQDTSTSRLVIDVAHRW
jgi:hypothetical protein